MTRYYVLVEQTLMVAEKTTTVTQKVPDLLVRHAQDTVHLIAMTMNIDALYPMIQSQDVPFLHYAFLRYKIIVVTIAITNNALSFATLMLMNSVPALLITSDAQHQTNAYQSALKNVPLNVLQMKSNAKDHSCAKDV
jgi:hypothetical protein